MSNSIEDMVRQFEALSPEIRAQLTEDVMRRTKHLKFIPNLGPQTMALLCPADQLLYGGQAGGGKTALLAGSALEYHQRSLLLRRKYSDMSALCEEVVTINGTRDGFVGGNRPKLRTADKRLIEFGACQHLGDEEGFQGQAHDLKGFDEVTQFLEKQVRYIIAWTRPGPGVSHEQKCQVIMATNPPVNSDGDWIIGYYRPWLDPTYHNPAIPGELRWVISDEKGEDHWVDGPTPVEINGRTMIPKSRTFIPARLSDNPYLVRAGYASTLDSLPEPMRSAMRDGNFMIDREDDANQLIPTKWVKAAHERWAAGRPAGIPMSALGVDVAQGGIDNTVVTARYDDWYDYPKSTPGSKTPDGIEVALIVIKERRNQAIVTMDMSGGYGGSAKTHLEDNGIKVEPFKGGEGSAKKDEYGQLGFFNKISEAYWRLREDLDPAKPGGSTTCLPPDPELTSQLCGRKVEYVRYNKMMCVKIESKDDFKGRMGISPDKADSTVMARWAGPRNVARPHPGRTIRGGRQGGTGKVNLGYANRKRQR